MKLMILTAQISPYHNARYVGVTRHFAETHIASSVNAGDFPEFLADSLGDYAIHKLFNGKDGYASAVRTGELVSQITGLCATLQPDAIAVAGWIAPESLAALKYGRENGVPTIVMSESQVDDAPRPLLREAIKKRLVSQFDAALVGGPSHAHYVATLGIPSDRIHLGYNAVDNAYFEGRATLARANSDKLRGEHGLPERYILASARFIRKKNLTNLVVAYADARQKMKMPPDLVILGDGPEHSEIQKAIHRSGVADCVHMPGFRGYDVLPAYYALAEGFLHVSTFEQWGLVINEAMASRVPVIASHTCGAARTVISDGVNGLLTDVDVSAISNAILRLFEMPQESRDAMALAGMFAIQEWGPERFGSGMRAAVRSAAEAPRRGPIAPWDRALLSYLQNKTIETVS
ncbi:glycosyltransferase [Altererythrobacter sp. GH1-8]|uniref:glycosyltransferase n=1 Tax=Altererythrobacter sp. GH1-8 TaxID=3349333 RepID=UPI00374D583E